MKQQKALTLKTLTKSNVWELQENDILRMWESAKKESDFKDNKRHYFDVIKSAFEIEEIKIDRPEVIKKYEARDFKIGSLGADEGDNSKWAIKKRQIMRVTDLTYENIRHISAAKLIEVLDRNFGGGWDSLSQSIQDIIESGFDISTTTLPKDRLHKPGGMYEKKVNDGFEVLEIARVHGLRPSSLRRSLKWRSQLQASKARQPRRLRTTTTKTMRTTTISICRTTSTMMTTTIHSMRTSSQRRAIAPHSIPTPKTSTLRQKTLPTTMTIINFEF